MGKDFEKNELIVGYEDDPLLYKTEVEIKDMNWISGESPSFPLECKVRSRHGQELQQAKIVSETKVEYKKPQRALAPGQFLVLYKNKECLGGGVIL